MKILLSGASGFVGSSLVPILKSQGHELSYLVRHKPDPRKQEIYFEAARGSIDKSGVEAFAPEAVIHLAGDPIAALRWTEEKKRRIRDSRVNGTQILATTLIHLQNPPKVWVAASAVGIFGSRGDEILTEESPPGNGFLAEVCKGWEAATQPAAEKGIRVVNTRFGHILSKKGGALKKMLTPFKLGLGGVIGNGRQYWAWVTLDDVLQALQQALKDEKLKGPYNVVTSQPVTNKEFTKTLGRVLWRPTCFPIPASTARMIFGEMADEMFLASARAVPKRLEEAGFSFQYPQLREALKHVLK